MVEDENLVYHSPSEMSNYLNVSNLDYENFNNDDLDNSDTLELPILKNSDILPPEEGSITRYANIFQKLDGSDSDSDDLSIIFRDSYSDSGLYNSNRLKNNPNSFNDNNHYDLDDQNSNKSLTFSDRVVKERQRMIRKQLLNENYFNQSTKPTLNRRRRNTVRPHVLEKSFSFVSSVEMAKVNLDSKTAEKHKRIDDMLKVQQDDINDLKFSSEKRDDSNNTDDTLFHLQEENNRLLSENEHSFERIRNLQMELENYQSDLIVERKQNEQLLKDKVDLQNRVNLLTKENKSLLSSQQLMQNMHNNEVEELKSKKSELSNKISKLEKDLDYFRDNLQESHKINEMLKSEITSLTDVYKNERAYLQKLKTENKRLMENNSIYKSQNYSLIEINDRLRNRTLFRNHTGEITTSNSSTVTNSSTTVHLTSNSTLYSPKLSPQRSLNTRFVGNLSDKDLNYFAKLTPKSNRSDDSAEICKLSQNYNLNNSSANSPGNLVSSSNNVNFGTADSSTNYNSTNYNSLDALLNSIADDKFDLDNSNNNNNHNNNHNNYNHYNHNNQNTFSDNASDNNSNTTKCNSSLTNSPLDNSNSNENHNYNIVRIIREERISNPTTKWVADRVSRNSSVEALESLREKIKNISTESNVENVNINSSLKCFQNNVTINLIQNKLQLISQRLHETTV